MPIYHPLGFNWHRLEGAGEAFPPQQMAFILAELLSKFSLKNVDVLQDFLRYFGVMAHRTNEAMMVMTTVVLNGGVCCV